MPRQLCSIRRICQSLEFCEILLSFYLSAPTRRTDRLQRSVQLIYQLDVL